MLTKATPHCASSQFTMSTMREALLKEKPYLISSMFSSCEGRAELLDLHTPADHPDACAAALQMPKVALMFLTPSDMPHEEFWGLWIRSAAGLVQVDCVALEVCENGRKLGELQKACLLNRRTGAVEQQHLFTLYVHTSPGHTGFKLGSVFRGHELPKHVLTTRNGHTDHTEATRLLLAAALEDPLNQRFILLNEGSIPLYPPTLVYQQLLGEESSRINACDNDANPNRWSPSMEKHVKKRHWRKHDGWFGLIRKHAQAVVEDIHVYNTFRTFCVTGFDKALDRHRDCWPDEHYVPTLLSVMGFEEETDCKGAVITAEWVTENEDAHVRSSACTHVYR
ncbi:hypothetical protein WJX72_008462 [[Myrmecia] bisecta]|uniref:Uncharacterized protein n=1 Tax=[Myrmecia] bisecta TaxID=41462 RepID=A0AAW1P8W8_9CHLO